MKHLCFLLLITLYICSHNDFVFCATIEVDLTGYTPKSETRNVFQKQINLDEDKTTIKIENIADDVGFFVIQVHSYMENITLSSNSTILVHSHITGTNVGLIYGYGDSSTKYYIFRDIKYYSHISVLLVIIVYDAYDPVPGGCNLSFANMVAPYQIVSYTDEYIAVDSQPPSAYGISCNDNKILVETFHLYLTEYDERIDTYFNGIRKMITVDNIRQNGRKVPSGEGYFLFHKLFSSYRGTGEVIAILSTYKNRSSAYVPAVSYGCDISNWDESCIGPVTRYWKFICALLLIIGLLVSFFGHRFFKLTLFVMGFAFGISLTYLVISLDDHFNVTEKAVTSIIVGFFYGIIWIFIWWKYGIPLLSIHLNFILGGFLIASIVFYAGLADVYIYRNNLDFWVTFLCIMLACMIIWSSVAKYGNIFSCCLLGSYALFIAFNYYIGGNLQYIVINIYRRATVDNFNHAIISPPFQIMDIMFSIGWLIIFGLGFHIQYMDQHGKPPFPPNRNGVILASSVSERTRLIPPENVSVPQYV